MAKKSKKSILIVESPGKIKKLKEILGEQFLVYASFGHIMELSKKRGNGLGVEVDNDFKAHYNFLPDKLHVVQALIDACSNAKDVWIASDSDREGECIAFHVRDAIISCGAPVYRVKFTEITKNAVLKAIENKGDFSEAQYNSQQSRRILDRLVGFLASPYIIKAFNDDKDMADIKLSAGRVQSVAIRLITDREKEIDIFNPEEYWHIFST